MTETAREYRATYAAIRDRILELNAQMRGLEPSDELNQMLLRRKTMYVELDELAHAIHDMEEYISLRRDGAAPVKHRPLDLPLMESRVRTHCLK